MDYELETQILFNMYGIHHYDTDAPGLCDDTSGARRDDDDRPDDSSGLGGDTSGHRDA